METSPTQEELEAGRGYEALFVPALFAPWTAHLIEAAGVEEGMHILDVACGSGILARDALTKSGETGRVVGLDAAPGMIAAAKEVEPGIEWIVAQAEALPFDDNVFDRIVSQFGMMFFQDRQRSTDEMYRVVKPNGRLALAIWHSIDQNPAYQDIVAVLDAEVSTAAGDAVRMPFCLGNPGEVEQALARSGFRDIEVETKVERARFPTPRTMVEVELRGWLPLFGIQLNEAEIADVLAKSELALAKYAAETGEAVFPTSAYILTARKRE